MKTFISILIFLGVFTLNNYSTHAQPANFLWVEQAGGAGSLAEGLAIATDGSGNSIVTGYFAGTVTFGDTKLTSAGFNFADIFIAKYDGDGNLLWVEQAGGTAGDFGNAIATDGSGNSIVTGWFKGTATFGDTTLMTGADNLKMFIAKYDGDGNFLWVVQAGGTDSDIGFAIATDGSGNSIVTGYFAGTATFGDTTLTSAGSADIFIAKYDGDGNFLWVEQAGGPDFDAGFAIATDGSGNSIVTGSFLFSATFGDTTLIAGGFSELPDIFIAKYDGDGNFLWVEQAGGKGGDEGQAIATDGSGNSIVTGYFGGTATFGDTTLTSAGSRDIFIAKYDGDGNFLWVEQAGGTDNDVGRGIATDGSGNNIVTGEFRGTATFGDTTLTSVGTWDIFITKLGAGVTGIEEEIALPQSFNLSQNYPNPFNPSTSIRYAISSKQFVTLKVYDVLGNEVATLVNEEKTAGSYEINFSAKGGASNLSSGIYFYKLQAGTYVETKKMILMK